MCFCLGTRMGIKCCNSAKCSEAQSCPLDLTYCEGFGWAPGLITRYLFQSFFNLSPEYSYPYPLPSVQPRWLWVGIPLPGTPWHPTLRSLGRQSAGWVWGFQSQHARFILGLCMPSWRSPAPVSWYKTTLFTYSTMTLTSFLLCLKNLGYPCHPLKSDVPRSCCGDPGLVTSAMLILHQQNLWSAIPTPGPQDKIIMQYCWSWVARSYPPQCSYCSLWRWRWFGRGFGGIFWKRHGGWWWCISRWGILISIETIICFLPW